MFEDLYAKIPFTTPWSLTDSPKMRDVMLGRPSFSWGLATGTLRLSLFNIGGASVIIYSHTPGRNLMARGFEHDGFVFSSRGYNFRRSIILGYVWVLQGCTGLFFARVFWTSRPPVMPPDRFSAKSCKALGLLDFWTEGPGSSTLGGSTLNSWESKVFPPKLPLPRHKALIRPY